MKTDVLHKIAKSKQVSMETIATEMGVSRMQAYRYLNNPKRLNVDQVLLIAEILNRSPQSLFSLIAKS